jgi:hypothetical protein
VTPNGSAATATLTLATNVSTALLEPAPPASAALAWLGGGAALGLVFLRRRRWAQYGLAALLAVGLCGLVQACGGGSKKSTGNNNTPAGNYTLTVTGTSGSTTQTATYSVTVQ